MELEEQRWPGCRWRLTAPESYMLIYGPQAGGSRPFKLALMKLVAGRSLTLTYAKIASFSVCGREASPCCRPVPITGRREVDLSAPFSTCSTRLLPT